MFDVGMSLVFTLAFVVISIGMSIVLGHLVLRASHHHINWQYISFGIGIFFVGIALHSVIALPVVISLHGFSAIIPVPNRPELTFALWELLYFAVAAGIGQEIAKSLPMWLELRRTARPPPTHRCFGLGLNIGLGFSVSEILLIGISSWQTIMDGLSLSNVWIGSLERQSATLFHMSTAGLIAFGIEQKQIRWFLLACIALHALLDFVAGWLAAFPIISLAMEEVLLFSFSMLLLITSMLVVKRSKRSRTIDLLI